MYRPALSILLIGLLCLFPVSAAVGAGSDATTYVIHAGDTLWGLARRYGVELDALMQLNGLRENSILQIGQSLRIPASGGGDPGAGELSGIGGYRVQAGDNLWRIAQAQGYQVEAVIAVNPGIKPERLQIGQLIQLPAAGDSASLTTGSRAAAGARYKGLFYDWPLLGSISSSYGYRRSGYHHGLDIAADTGTYVRVAAPGQVSYAGWMNVYGYTVIVNHPDGRQTLYGHNSQLLVNQGETVRRGQFVARVGSTGRSTGPHLHFEVRINGQAQNPLYYLPQR